ncbi:uncharacterized protein LOC115093242 [Rhinatrema bivittatum]|uniref:uncharacterized protein LOC115093242 n=1 Tax=Rhinatrema bivittatum TaxID=194408 RepID=UPI00112E09B4|nr:uncharacterized protein LOC115093242 [Rhinatrema bivittatum]
MQKSPFLPPGVQNPQAEQCGHLECIAKQEDQEGNMQMAFFCPQPSFKMRKHKVSSSPMCHFSEAKLTKNRYSPIEIPPCKALKQRYARCRRPEQVMPPCHPKNEELVNAKMLEGGHKKEFSTGHISPGISFECNGCQGFVCESQRGKRADAVNMLNWSETEIPLSQIEHPLHVKGSFIQPQKHPQINFMTERSAVQRHQNSLQICCKQQEQSTMPLPTPRYKRETKCCLSPEFFRNCKLSAIKNNNNNDPQHYNIHQTPGSYFQEPQCVRKESTFNVHQLCSVNQANSMQKSHLHFQINANDQGKGQENRAHFTGAALAQPLHGNGSSSGCGAINSDLQQCPLSSTSAQNFHNFQGNNSESLSRFANTGFPSASDVRTNHFLASNVCDQKTQLCEHDLINHMECAAAPMSQPWENRNLSVHSNHNYQYQCHSSQSKNEPYSAKNLQSEINLQVIQTVQEINFPLQTVKDDSLNPCQLTMASSGLSCNFIPEPGLQTVKTGSLNPVSPSKDTEDNCATVTFEDSIEMFDLSLLQNAPARTADKPFCTLGDGQSFNDVGFTVNSANIFSHILDMDLPKGKDFNLSAEDLNFKNLMDLDTTFNDDFCWKDI